MSRLCKRQTLLVAFSVFALGAAACAPDDPDAPAPAPAARTLHAAQDAAPNTPQPTDASDSASEADVFRTTLRAQRVEGPNGLQYGYNGLNPGPTLRVPLGASVEIELINELDVPTTIHWHGLHVPFPMDGVVWMGAPVEPGETFTYRFTADQPGTFWYHPHVDTARQVDAGLYGAFVVEDPFEAEAMEAVANDWVFVLDSIDEWSEEGAHPVHGHGRVVRRWQVNAVEAGEVLVGAGEVIRARLVNAANHGTAAVEPVLVQADGSEAPASWAQIGSDQGLLASARSPDRVLLASGDRAEVLFSLGEGESLRLEAAGYSLNGGDTGWPAAPLVTFRAEGSGSASALPAFPHVARAPTADPGHTDILYAFAGTDRTDEWYINGEQFPNVTIETIPAGAPRVLEFRNLSSSEHPLHIHGMSFEVLSVNGVAPDAYTLEDTWNLAIRDIVRVRVETTNRGDWMTHCHILEHAEAGMMTVLRVE